MTIADHGRRACRVLGDGVGADRGCGRGFFNNNN